MIRRRRSRHPAHQLAVASAVLATLLVGACGDDGDEGGGDGSNNNAQVCSDVDALRTSVAGITEVTVDADVLTSLQDQVDQVRTDVSTLIDDAQDAYGPEVSDVDQAVSGLTKSLEAAAEDPSAATLSDVRTARQALTSAVTALTGAVTDC
ncbi:hypothetical protein [Nocardioides sp. Soil805]|uniref:hypothetical protein n=1 Tax=Nocardioides sp. Soil805 TaxID=1736416 RepID=UPI000703642A|nr:hypothetical protein [Nocardioides sp. Soil805]KRF36455.1 hypothetical protein ASG94_03090 [Nocardioides sp. Soil805]